AAVARGIAYAEAGADLVWMNTLQSREQIGEACRRIPVPVLAAYGGPAPSPTLEEYQQLGAAVALFPALTTNVALQAAWDLLHDFKARGTAALADSAGRARSSPWGEAKRAELIGADRIRELEEAFLPTDLQRDYERTFGFKSKPA